MNMEHPDDRYGEWVRQRRKDLRLSRERLAAKAGVSAGTVLNVERGRPFLYTTRKLLDLVLREERA